MLLRLRCPLRHRQISISLSGGWAKRAADLGWDTLALFGCHPTRPLGHFNGLLWRISGGKITAMQSDWQRSRSTGSGASTCPTKFWWGSLLGAMVRDRMATLAVMHFGR
jgi:hypothetical protein